MRWLGLPFALFLALPLVALVWGVSPQALTEAVHRPETSDALFVSLRTTGVTLAVLILLGTPFAWFLGTHRGLGHGCVATLSELPAVLPPSVAGIALLVAFGHAGLIGRHLPMEIPFTATAVILAQLFVASPFFLRPAGDAFSRLDHTLFEAARLDGAGRWSLAAAIVWPLTRRAYLGALCLAWARSLGEFGATLLFAGNFQGTTQTAPLAIYDAFETDLGAARALSVLLLIFAAVILALAKLTAGRQSEANP